MNTVMDILNSRASTHGTFADNATLTFDLNTIINASPNACAGNLTKSQRIAIFMILHKIARICSGNPNEPDHWNDIAGYATLIVRELNND